ncbi:MAG: M20 metallopeptidase family protein [Saezia sp.]
MNLIQQAQALRAEMIDSRRALHAFPEIGFELPRTTAFVEAKLKEYGYKPQRMGKAGIICTLGQGDKTFLLRADMDALPMQEDSSESFCSTNGNAHACGHDAHTAMLLGAAKLLKDNEAALKGCVKLMFQPAEEILGGALDMIEHGLLENPKVDAAMALHIVVGIEQAKTGKIYTKAGDLTYSGDAIQIKIIGKDAHGSTPHLGIDANVIAAQIIVALQNIIAKEVPPGEKAVVLVGKMAGGTAVNTVAGEAILDVSARARSVEMRAFLKQRIKEIATGVALSFGAKAEVNFVYGMPPLVNDAQLNEELKHYCQELLGADHVEEMKMLNGTEDFSMVTERLPAVLFTLGVGSIAEGYEHALHHPAMRINEQALPIGAAIYAGCAMKWLAKNAS